MPRLNGVTIVLVALVAVLAIALVLLFQGGPTQRHDVQEIAYSQFLHDQKKIRDVTIRGTELTGHFTDNRPFMTRLPADPAIATRLAEADVQVSIGPADDPSTSWTTILVNILSLAIGLFWLIPLFRIARALERKAPGAAVE